MSFCCVDNVNWITFLMVHKQQNLVSWSRCFGVKEIVSKPNVLDHSWQGFSMRSLLRKCLFPQDWWVGLGRGLKKLKTTQGQTLECRMFSSTNISRLVYDLTDRREHHY